MSIQNAYNSWAGQYDSNENKTRDLDAVATRETLSRFSFKKVLELGCGTGKNTVWFLEQGAQVIGLDFSSEMLKLAKEKIKDEKVEFRQMDLNQPWKMDDQFADLVTSSLTLEHISDLNPIFRQAHLKLQEKGLFFICELHPFKQYLGSKAKYEGEGGVVELTVFTHHISEYLDVARKNDFELMELGEWFDEGVENGVPRLVSFVFRKQNSKKKE